jgi:hypothetical protein
MDIYDEATEAEERHRDIALNKVRSQKPAKFSGRCLSCNAETEARFCPGTECRDDFELQQKIAKIKGIR